MKKQLPTGVQTLQEFTDDNLYYVDKTEHIFKMASTKKCYFLSRPRRFGKTLLLETIKSLFEGKKDLFKDTYIYDKWDFKQNTCPVIFLDFAGGKYKKEGKIEDEIITQLASLEKKNNIVGGDRHIPIAVRLKNIIESISKKNNDVVVLIDEYDQPILDVITDQKLAESNRDSVAGIYAAIKRSRQFLRFVFVTGITMFSKDDMSSGMNHFTDISLDPDFSTICGYTEKELCDVFSPELKGVDIKEVRDYYNGYSWDGETSVYNPFAILNFLAKKTINSWWYQTYTPKIFYNLLKEQEFYLTEIGKCSVESTRIVNFDVTNIDIDPLLFQIGIYTIKKIQYNDRGHLIGYYLDFPNTEVKQSFAAHFYDDNYARADRKVFKNHGREFIKFLKLGEFNKAMTSLHSLYAIFPSLNIKITNTEAWYGSNLFYSLAGNDCIVSAEDPSNKGRADIVLEDKDHVFVFELKVIESTTKNQQTLINRAKKAAFKQILEKGYLDKYSEFKNTIYACALIIDKRKKNVVSLTFKKKPELVKESR